MDGILVVESKRDLKKFEQLPEQIQSKDPYFIPPFPGSICKLIGPRGVFQQKHGVIRCFLALRAGKPVGRIAAIINRSHNKYYGDKTGFFGFFDCIDDQQVAASLFQAACRFLSEQGLATIRGPYNPTVNDEVGLLVEGFDSSPFVMMSYNPEYYLGLYEGLDLRVARELSAFYMSADRDVPERIKKIVARIKKSSGVTLRTIDMSRLKDELRVIHALYNVTLDRNWGFVPISYEDLEYAEADLKAIVDPELVLIAEKNGQPIGFSLVIPNINELMWKVKKSPRWLRALRFIWKLKTSHPKEARVAILGVHPDFRTLGLGSLFYYESFTRGKVKFIGAEFSWIDSDNDEIIKGMTLMGGKPYKKYRIFEKTIAV